MKMLITLLCLVLCLNIVTYAGEYEIQLKKGAGETSEFAAKELSEYLQKIFNQPFIVIKTSKPDLTTSLLLIEKGRQVDLPKGILEQAKKLGSDGFVIKSFPGGIAFAGGSPRGLLFAIYTFLEQYAGCRWYYPYPEDQIVPKHDLKKLEKIISNGINLAEKPDFSYRQREFRDHQPNVPASDELIIQQIDWWAKLRMNCFLVNFGYAQSKWLWPKWKKKFFPEIKKRGMLIGIGEHGSYGMFLNPAIHFKKHPEWYCEVKGKRIGDMSKAQFCTSNPEALKTYLDNFAKFARENPEIDVYYPAPNDNKPWCECVDCRKLSISDRYLALDNQIAEKLVKIRPDYRVLHLAYENHRLLPEKVKPHPNVDIDVACWGRNYAYPLSDPRTAPRDKNYLTVFKDWLKLCQGTNSQVIYHCKYMRRLWSQPHLSPLKILDQDMPYLKKMGVAGFDLPLGFIGIWTKAPNAYVVAQTCWNADANRSEITKKYFKLYYGNAASTAKRVYELVDEALPNMIYGTNLTQALIWRKRLLTPRIGNSPEILADTKNSETKLNEALNATNAAIDQTKDEVTRQRLRKLATVVRQIQCEQRFLKTTVSLAETLSEVEKTNDADTLKTKSDQVLSLLDILKKSHEEMKANYRPEDHLNGLLWAGPKHGMLSDCVSKWPSFAKNALCPVKWKELGKWQSSDFANNNRTIEKEFDITDGIEAGTVLARWKYTGGQFGLNILEVSLWEVNNGVRKRVAKDHHHGFTGGQDRNSTYRLRIDKLNPDARYIITGRIQAAGLGSVAKKGCQGKILLGTKSTNSN